jgi:hypothetical protein
MGSPSEADLKPGGQHITTHRLPENPAVHHSKMDRRMAAMGHFSRRRSGPGAGLCPQYLRSRRIDAMDLKHVLGDIQTNCGNLHVDGSLM